MTTLKIGISPCPNDTFIFENMVNRTVSMPGISFEWEYHDIQVLNQKASEGYFDIVKVSFAHLQHIENEYQLLQSGGALGFGVGPLLVKKKNHLLSPGPTCLIPGINTTANFLLSHFYPQFNDKKVVIFSDIENQIIHETAELGLLIHEGRFTYQDRGLELVADLGTLWQTHENLPIPLGCIVAKKDLGYEVINKLEKTITNSISNFDLNGQPIISDFIKSHAQELSERVMLQHINLYVNEYSKHLGTIGLAAIERMQKIQNLRKE